MRIFLVVYLIVHLLTRTLVGVQPSFEEGIRKMIDYEQSVLPVILLKPSSDTDE